MRIEDRAAGRFALDTAAPAGGTVATDERTAHAAVEAYFAAWNATDPDERRSRIAEAYTPDAIYTDPLAQSQGPEAIAEMIAGVQAQFPAHTLRPTSALDVHHACVRFSWAMAGPDGADVLEGIDVGVIAADGRLQKVIGFIGDVAPVSAR